MLGFESKVLMVEHVDLLLLQNGTVVFTRPVLVIIVDVELLFKSQKKQTNKQKHSSWYNLIANNLYLQEKRARISLTLLLSPLKNEKN